MMMGWFWIWPLLMLIGLILLGYLFYRLVRSRGGGPAAVPPSSARDILDRRFAGGEIDEQEYRTRREGLR